MNLLVTKTTKSYIKDALISFFIVLTISVGTLVMCILKLYDGSTESRKFIIGVVVVLVIFHIIEFFLHQRIGFLAFLDRRNNDIVSSFVKIKTLSNEPTSSLKYGNSFIRFMYPKNMNCYSHRIETMNDFGVKIILRAIMSSKNVNNFFELFILDSTSICNCAEVTYLKKSKILLKIKVIGEYEKTRNGKIVRALKEKDKIEELLSEINEFTV